MTGAGAGAAEHESLRPRPAPDDLTRPYWDAAAAHELRIMRCDACGAFRHPPVEKCWQCGADTVTWTRLSGEAQIWSFVIDYRNLVPGFSGPYAVALVVPVETGDQVRIVANVVDCPIDDIYVGMPVQVTWEQLGDGVTLPQFTPSERVGFL